MLQSEHGQKGAANRCGCCDVDASTGGDELAGGGGLQADDAVHMGRGNRLQGDDAVDGCHGHMVLVLEMVTLVYGTERDSAGNKSVLVEEVRR